MPGAPSYSAPLIAFLVLRSSRCAPYPLCPSGGTLRVPKTPYS